MWHTALRHQKNKRVRLHGFKHREARALTVHESPAKHKKKKKSRPSVNRAAAIWRVTSEMPLACRLGAVETEISQTKLMRTSGGGSTYSLSRLSSLWLLVHSDTLPCLCKTLVFLRPPKGVQQWLNTPKWPYQLFDYFSCGWWWMMRIQARACLAWPGMAQYPWGFGAQRLYQTFRQMSELKEKWRRGSFDQAAEVTFTSRSLCFIHILPLFFIIQGL